MSTSLRSPKSVDARRPASGSGRGTVLERRPAAHGRGGRLNRHDVSEPADRVWLAVGPERLSGLALSGCRRRPGVRFGSRRGVAGLVAVCVLALGVAACSVRDAKAEASASASASASAAIARAEKGIADANASATASREAALTPSCEPSAMPPWPNPHRPSPHS